jgi:hypothetical protein
MGTIINIIKINFLILTNYLPAVEELDNGLNEYLFKLNGDIFTAKLIMIIFFTPYSYTDSLQARYADKDKDGYIRFCNCRDIIIIRK